MFTRRTPAGRTALHAEAIARHPGQITRSSYPAEKPQVLLVEEDYWRKVTRSLSPDDQREATGSRPRASCAPMPGKSSGNPPAPLARPAAALCQREDWRPLRNGTFTLRLPFSFRNDLVNSCRPAARVRDDE